MSSQSYKLMNMTKAEGSSTPLNLNL